MEVKMIYIVDRIENNIYTLDKKEEEERKKTILDKFNKLKNKDIH